MTTIGTVFNIQRYSLHDGPGIRTTVFLKGCPLSCAWCHNPEGRAAERALRLMPARCMHCGRCIEVCPRHDSPVAQLPYQTSLCTLCGTCIDACPTGAREIVGQPMTVAQVVAEVLRDRIFLDQSGGGVTVSGGEPLQQGEFVCQLFDALRHESIHTALDTCGNAPRSILLETATKADLVLYDIKALDTVVHRRYTGVSNELILSNLKALVRVHGRVWIRIPLISGVNNAPSELVRLARFIATLGAIQQVNVLPYHALGTAKDRLNSSPATGHRLPELAPSEIQQAVEIFQAEGLETYIGG